jgi:uncharacterized membrane protein YgcG
VNDDQLLEHLSAALVPAAVPPTPPVALHALHRAITASQAVGTVPARRAGRPLLAIGLAGAVAIGGVAIFVVAMSLPRIDSETATRIIVTITSPAVGEVAEQRRDLEEALAAGDDGATVREAAELRLAIARLSAGEWASIRSEVEDLLARADALLERGRTGNDEAPGVSRTVTSTTQASVIPVVTQPPTSAVVQATSPLHTSPSVTSPVVVDDDNSGPGGGQPEEDNSGPGGGEASEDNSGPGGGGSGDSGSGGSSGSG